MNVLELEGIVRDELRRDAANAPSGGQLRVAVLEAVVGVPMTDRAGRRWTVPLLVAAAMVALAVAATLLLPRALGRHSQPAHPAPSVSLPAAPAPVNMQPGCTKGQRLVNGANTRYTTATGADRYVYEYYCAGPDGSRTGSLVEVFHQSGGRLGYDQTLRSVGPGKYVMSMTGGADQLRIRVYDADPGTRRLPGGSVSDLDFDVTGDAAASTTSVAGPCFAGNLEVWIGSAAQPIPHPVLRVTNQAGVACAVWGNPRYTPAETGRQLDVRYVVRGPAGGLGAEPSPPVLLLQPGQTATAAIGYDKATAPCSSYLLRIGLTNGLDLAARKAPSCGNLVSYPLVAAGNGSEEHPEPEAPVSPSGNCGDLNGILTTESGVRRSGNRASMVVRLRADGVEAVSCFLTGYPEVRALDADDNLLAMAQETRHGPLGGLSQADLPRVTVAPGRAASVLVEWSTTGSRCIPNGWIAFSLVTSTVTIRDPIGRFCDLQVHPFVAGPTGSG